MQDSNTKKTEPEKVKTSRKTLRWLEIFSFLIFFAIVLRAVSVIMYPTIQEHPEIVSNIDQNVVAPLSEEPNSIDVLIIGDSEARVMVSTKLLMNEAGIASYNCNQLGQRAVDTYIFLKKILKTQHPKVIIFETNVLTHKTSMKQEALLTHSSIMYEAFPVLRFHTSSKYLSGLVEPNPYEEYKGFKEVYVVDPYNGDDYMIETEDTATINPINIYYMDKICDLCKEEEIPLVFFSSPSPINMDYSKHNAIQEYADEHSIEFIDFNLLTDELGIDWSQDTGDAGDHINTYGTDKTTRYIIDYLKKNYDLPDHREE